jgi:uncharacterized membrane protein YphA (DoxX/SURF4 family)
MVGKAKQYAFVELLLAAFVAAVFVQSGLDKILDWKGNSEWLSGHVHKSTQLSCCWLLRQIELQMALSTCTRIATTKLLLLR